MAALLQCLSTPQMLGVALAPPGSTLGPRRPRGFELVWMIEGSADYEHGDRRVHAPEGSLVLCCADVRDAFSWDAERGCRHAYVQFELHEHPAELPAPEAWPVLCQPGDGDVVRPLFRHLLTYGTEGPPELCRLTLAHLLVSVVLGRTAAHEPPRQYMPAPVEEAAVHITRMLGADPAARITLPELAAVAHVTPEHLCRLFATWVGASPMESVRRARLDRAASLLARSNLSIAEIAQHVGFADAFSFSKAFKRVYGQPPSRLRDAIHAGQAPPPRPFASRLDMPPPPSAMGASDRG